MKRLSLAAFLVLTAPALLSVPPRSEGAKAAPPAAGKARKRSGARLPANPPRAAPLPRPLLRLMEKGAYDELLRRLEFETGDLSGRRAFLRGYALLKRGRFREAIPRLREALERIPPLRAHTLFFLARAAEGAKDDETARRSLRELLRIDAGTPHALYAHETLAAIALRAGRPLEAARWLGRFIRRHPAHDRIPSLLARRARALEAGGRLHEAAHLWKELWLRYPGARESNGALRKAEELAIRSKSPLHPLRDLDYYRRARRLWKDNLFRKALEAFRDLNRRFPKSPYRRRASLYEALALFSLRRSREAGDALWAAAKRFPAGARERARARYHLARNHLRREDQTAFESEVETLLKESPHGKWAARTRYLLARVLEDERQFGAAKRHYRDLVRRHPASPLVPKALWQIAWIRFRSRDYEAAAEGFRRLSRRHPNSPLVSSALYWAAAAEERATKPEAAVKLYRRCARIFRHVYYGHLCRRALRRLARNGSAEAARPLALPSAGYRRWIRPPSAPLGRRRRARWAAAALLASLGLYRLAGEEYARTDPRPYFRLKAARFFVKGREVGRAVAIFHENFWDAIRSGGKDLPPAFWRIAYPLLVKQGEPGGAPPLLVNAIIKAESVFDPKVRSPAGAVGLMQLMPGTGRRLARRHKIPLSSTERLFDPSINVLLGTKFLSELYRYYKGALIPTIASYNAGRAVVRKWWSARGEEPLDSFIERIPYQETRYYVMKVLGYYREYRRIYPELARTAPKAGVFP